MNKELVKARIISLVVRFTTYILEGLVVYVVLCVIPNYKSKINTQQAIVMSVMIASSLALLDAFTSFGSSTRQGVGYGLGFGLVGFPKRI